MQNIRPVSEKKWDISNHAFYQAYHFAMRYKEFKDILRYKTNTVGSPKFGDTTGSGVTKSATEELAIKRAWAKKNYKMIEESAKQADQQLYKYILKAVTEEGITYKYLKTVNEDMKIGAKIALEGVKEELIKVRAELKRKGYDNRRGFTTIEAYIDDSIKELK